VRDCYLPRETASDPAAGVSVGVRRASRRASPNATLLLFVRRKADSARPRSGRRRSAKPNGL
jgi:hypothetical protein